MDPTLSRSKSLPSNLATVRRHRASISVSASYQSHLSSPGSLHRVRTASEQIPLGPMDSSKDDLHVLESGLAGQSPRPRTGRLYSVKQFVTDPATFLSDDLRRMCGGHVWRPRALVTLYCCFCVLFLTVRIHAFVLEAFQAARPLDDQPVPSAGEADMGWGGASPSSLNLTSSQRLSVAFRQLPPTAHLETVVARARPGPRPSHASDLTACLWTSDAPIEVERALASAASWPGPVSLVVVTTHAPDAPGYAALRERLASAMVGAGAHAHVLRVPSVAGVSANAYLNAARFLARTPRVALFPDHRRVVPRAGWLDALPADARHPVLLGNATGGAYAPTLAPVVLPRDHPAWCTERTYLFGSRALDWEDCLWKLWLESAGEASSTVVPLLLDEYKNASAPSVSSYVMKMRLRWSTKYKSEACAFTLKRSQALGSPSRTEKKHVQWKRKFCRETVGPGALDVP